MVPLFLRVSAPNNPGKKLIAIEQSCK